MPRMIGHTSPVLILDEHESRPFTEDLRKPKASSKLARRSRPSMPSTDVARANRYRCARTRTPRKRYVRKIQNDESMRCEADVESRVTAIARANRRPKRQAFAAAGMARIQVPPRAFGLSYYRHNSFIERLNRVTLHQQRVSHSCHSQKRYVATARLRRCAIYLTV
jgi:hypothetical protein